MELGSLPFEQIADFEQPFFPVDRSGFLRAWIGQPESTALGILDDGRLVAHGVIRRCLTGWKIGPLFAESRPLAERLLVALQSRAPVDDPVYLDVPEANPEALALARGQGMQVVFETARMYRGEAPSLPVERLFGVTSFEIG